MKNYLVMSWKCQIIAMMSAITNFHFIGFPLLRTSRQTNRYGFTHTHAHTHVYMCTYTRTLMHKASCSQGKLVAHTLGMQLAEECLKFARIHFSLTAEVQVWSWLRGLAFHYYCFLCDVKETTISIFMGQSCKIHQTLICSRTGSGSL